MKRLLLCIIMCTQLIYTTNDHNHSNDRRDIQTIIADLSDKHDNLLEGLTHKGYQNTNDYNILAKTMTKLSRKQTSHRKSLPTTKRELQTYHNQLHKILTRNSTPVPQRKTTSQK